MAGHADSIKGPKKKKCKQESEFKVHIYEDEIERIREWVNMKPDIETGGDLFGLWIDDHTAVVQFVLGPGKDCRRTHTSFFQDISYLKDTGTYLTARQGLCNIGQWHSHHKIPLFEPSAGDCNTVWNNMPTLGMERYIVFIANIKASAVTINCFLFEINNGKYLQGRFDKIPGESPFRLNNDVMESVRIGAESLREMKRESKHSQESSGQTETQTAQLPRADREIPGDNANMPINKGDSVGDTKTATAGAVNSGFEGDETVDNSKMMGTKNNSKHEESNKPVGSSNITNTHVSPQQKATILQQPKPTNELDNANPNENNGKDDSSVTSQPESSNGSSQKSNINNSFCLKCTRRCRRRCYQCCSCQ